MRIFALIPFLLCSCIESPSPVLGPPIYRHEVQQIAESYENVQWLPKAKNRLHGPDSKGIWVHTPDATSGYDKPNFWWVPDQLATGMPYKWGGFDTPQSFLSQLNSDDPCYAGDISSEQKRKDNNDAISAEAVGVDCSGFVSRCWKLPRPYSTYEMAAITQPLESFDELKRGDALNIPRNHILIFLYWANPERTAFIGTESGPLPTWKVARKKFSVAYLKALGYKPIRYKNILENE